MSSIKLTVYLDYWKDKIIEDLDQESITIIERFDKELVASDFSENTRKGYLYTIHNFLTFLNKPISSVTKNDMIEFLNHLRQENKKQSTRRFYNRKLARFFKWYNPELDFYINFAKSTKETELPDWSEKLPTMEEIEKMLAVCTYSRDRALFSVMVESGARIGEILRMTYADVKIHDNYIRISLRGRTTKRDIPVIWSSKYLMHWLDLHPTKKPTDPLWPRKRQPDKKELAHLEYQGAYLFIKGLAEKAEITKSINPHLFRHLRSTILAKDPRTSSQVKKAYLGHSPASTTFEKTYSHLSQEDVIESILQSYGLKEGETLIEQVPELKGEYCPRCNAPITRSDKYCSKCWFILDQDAAMAEASIIERQQEEIESLKLEIIEIKELFEKIKMHLD